ncbi:hypothetical protein GCM10010965_18500 [Caldalkalibacillus thermarum]|uniref:nucleotidyltransferase domain-containing protein n=1 Tax=Caldalkalibacillus thermarum TaxID=296745 RepID=UPI00166B9B9A|nr:nucleotidyltransferase domain-containing protein [Caldalkalibacillus thermarum]GGK17001.1 hypothetical protein GCM10010965_07560 [Caldalkalibacillus thermarum]GGK26052.1 hypothetical protein GCM10010965_18500 [Caldalkalibacillus thermarum]
MAFDPHFSGLSPRFVDQLKTYCAANKKVKKVILFGSRARGEHRQTSDIDLAIETDQASHSQQNLIEDAIREIPTPLKVDVLFIDRLENEDLIGDIMREGVVIYDQGETSPQT